MEIDTSEVMTVGQRVMKRLKEKRRRLKYADSEGVAGAQR